MKCPRLHGSLEPVMLNADYSSPLQAYLCRTCHGVWMRAMECRTYLGLECDKMANRASIAPIDLSCPHCQSYLKVYLLDMENLGVEFHVCPRCFSCFFDATQFALIFSKQLKSERDVSGILDKTPLDNLEIACCDCDTSVNHLSELHDVGIGYCCQNCYQAPPIISENKIQNVQLVTFHGMEIKIDHWQMSARSRISVTPVEPCLLDVSLFSLTVIQRILRCGHRKLQLHGELGRHLDATEDIEHMTPWHLFLKQRGVIENFNALSRLGQIVVTFKPHSIVFELTARRAGLDTRMKFESTVRHLLIAYERFVVLCQSYEKET